MAQMCITILFETATIKKQQQPNNNKKQQKTPQLYWFPSTAYYDEYGINSGRL